MKMRLLLLILASAALLGGCVSTSGYRSHGGTSHSVGVGYSHGRSSAGYGYQRGYPGSYGYGSQGYGSQGYYRDRFYGDDYYRYGPGSYGYGAYGNGSHGYGSYGYGSHGYGSHGYGSPYRQGPASRYGNSGYRGYPYSVPRYRVIHPGNGYSGHPYYRPGYQGHAPNRPRTMPPRNGARPPWRDLGPPPPVTQVTPPPNQPGNITAPSASTPRGDVERGLRRYKGGEVPVDD